MNTIDETKDAELTREGNNVIYELHISFIDAVLGTTVDVPTLDGSKTKIKVKPGTQGGEIHRLEDRAKRGVCLTWGTAARMYA